MVSGARLELGEGTGHRQGKGLHLTDLLPVLLRGIRDGVVLVEGIEVITVYGRTGPVGLRHTPGQHNTGLAWHQLQLGLLRRGGLGSLRGQAAYGDWCHRERGQGQGGGPCRRGSGYRAGFQRRVLQGTKQV